MTIFEMVGLPKLETPIRTKCCDTCTCYECTPNECTCDCHCECKPAIKGDD